MGIFSAQFRPCSNTDSRWDGIFPPKGRHRDKHRAQISYETPLDTLWAWVHSCVVSSRGRGDTAWKGRSEASHGADGRGAGNIPQHLPTMQLEVLGGPLVRRK